MASKLRFMSYNVRYFGHTTKGLFSTRGAMRAIARQMASLLPLCDVVCLQEVETHSVRTGLVTSRRRTQLPCFLQELDHAMARRQCPWRYRSYYFPAHRYRLSRRLDIYTTGLAILLSPRVTVVGGQQRLIDQLIFVTHLTRRKPFRRITAVSKLTPEFSQKFTSLQGRKQK